tara:strand:- start:853 stop:1677 length:825 start_codon:yes stop_codon:yes gene_type:complete
MNKKLDFYSLNDVYYSMINERKSNIMSINTKLVTEQYQNEILVDLKSEIDNYLNLDITLDNVDNDIRKDCLEWSLTGEIENESEKYERLIRNTMNDKNSSTLREQVTLDLLDDYVDIPGKHFYDGYNSSTKVYGEVKPVNSGKLDGGGGITDFASEDNIKRLIKDHYLWSNDRLNMIVSGFVNGRIVYIIEFPYSYKPFSQSLIDYSFDRFEGKTKEDVKNGNSRQGKSTRVFNFNYNDYKDCPDLKIRFINEDISDYESNLTKPFFKFLMDNV